MAATSFDPRNPRIVAKYGIAEITDAVVEGSGSQSFKAGELVNVSAGKIKVATTSTASSGVYGIALKDATGSSSSQMAVQLIGPDDLLDMYIVDSSGSAKVHTSLTEGTVYDLKVSSGIHAVNASDTTNGAFVFVRGWDDSSGSATSRGRFRLLLANNQNLL